VRYTFTLLFLLIFTTTGTAQLTKGDQVLTLAPPTGVAGYSQSNLTDDGLARLQYFPEIDFFNIAGGVTYGYAVDDRLLVGATLERGRGEFDWAFAPYVRYYAVSKPNLGLFVQASSGLNNGFGEVEAFTSGTLSAGLQLPLTDNVRVGPLLDYFVQAGRNRTRLGAQIEIVPGRNTRVDAASLPSFGRGSIMLGAQSASVELSRNYTGGNLTVGGFYFLSDRLAVGASVGAIGYRFSSSRPGGGDQVSRSTFYVIGTGARYYLTTGRRLLWYLEAGAGYIGQVRTGFLASSVDIRTSSSSAYLAAGGGLQYFLRENVALEVAPQIQQFFLQGDDGVGLSVPVGVRFFF
jgi:hypothetical protein